MAKKLYVGNLSFGTTEDKLKEVFSAFGQVDSVKIVTDKVTGMSKGFGFIEFDDSADSDKAIAVLSGKEVDGRKIRVNYSEEKRSPHARS